MGGVRTPWADVPTIALSGEADDPANFAAMLAGSGVPFDAERLARLYPGGREDYLRRFTRALDRAIRAGHLLAADREEILAMLEPIQVPESHPDVTVGVRATAASHRDAQFIREEAEQFIRG